jgi:hypothetical protein
VLFEEGKAWNGGKEVDVDVKESAIHGKTAYNFDFTRLVTGRVVSIPLVRTFHATR